MTYSDLSILGSALAQLSGTVTHLIDAKPVAVNLHFTGATRLKIAKLSVAVKAALAPFEAAREAIIMQHGGPFATADQPGQWEASVEINVLAKSDGGEVTAELPESEFTRDDNPVPPAILEVLLPLLK